MFSGRVLVAITGASRGLGRAIAVKMAEQFASADKLAFVLMSRSQADLEVTANMCRQANARCECDVKVVDVSTADKSDFESALNADFGVVDNAFDTVVVVHNAGSLGNQGTACRDYDDIPVMLDYFRANVLSAAALNAVFARKYLASRHKFAVNISSLAAIKAFPTWASYCTGKAARDSFFRVFASEEPGWRVLNYAPGPLDTAMIDDLLRDPRTHADIRESFEGMRAGGKLLRPEASAEKLCRLLSTPESFVSGDHVDYFD